MLQKIAIIGECMLEVSSPSQLTDNSPHPASLSFGGDTLNTAVYLSRLGVEVEYITALGDDSMSDWLLGQWSKEGVGCNLVKRFPDSVPGLYMIQLDEKGERSFLYWRKNSPATRILDDAESACELFKQIQDYAWVYLSGITLALYSDDARELLFELLNDYREHGGRIIFDNNYRPAQWADKSSAVNAYNTMYRLTDIALPSLEDEMLVSGLSNDDQILKRLRGFGVEELVIKMGEKSCLVVSETQKEYVKTESVNVVDTTSAGDAFNAGYIAARLNDVPPVEASLFGHRLAGTVIQHHGAIIPESAMPFTGIG